MHVTTNHCRLTERGFTLLETLVAIAIFSTISLAVYSTLNQYFSINERLHEENERSAEIDRFVSLLERDIRYAINRGIRLEYGDVEAALVNEQDDGKLISMTTSIPDYDSPGDSRLMRVDWYQGDHAVYRAHWLVLDRAQDSVPIRRKVLSNVGNVAVQVIPALGDLHETETEGDGYLVRIDLDMPGDFDISKTVRLSGEF
ncbi:MAG: hypothetical protein DHS20C01_06390 [marine bacterium B5-7]|nr:MAG: hypothetical protein DHS20C01_06390 [marine bacterium B5-7]